MTSLPNVASVIEGMKAVKSSAATSKSEISNNENEFWDGKGAQKGAYYWILKLASPFIDGGAVTYMQGLVYVN